MALDTHSLIFYLSAWESLSMTVAAERHQVSVAAVSAGIRRLENLLQIPLFIRSGKGIVATQGSASVTRFITNLLGGLRKIEFAFADQGAPIDMKTLEHETEKLLADRRLLRSFLDDCRRLRVSTVLIVRFVAVFEHRSIRAAGLSLDVSQPQISKQMAELESILGTRLFERAPRGILAQPDAKILYQSALQLSDICERLSHRGDLLFRREVTTTHIGTVPPFTTASVLCNRLSALCEIWRKRFPKAQIRISADTTDQLFARLKRNELHAAIVDSPEVPGEFCSIPLSKRPLMMAVHRPIGEERENAAHMPSFAEVIRTRPFVLPSRQSSLRVLIDDWMQHSNIQFGNVIEVESMTVIADLIGRYNYCSLLPKESAPDKGGFDFVPIPDAPELAQHLVWKPEMSENRHVTRVIKAITNSV